MFLKKAGTTAVEWLISSLNVRWGGRIYKNCVTLKVREGRDTRQAGQGRKMLEDKRSFNYPRKLGYLEGAVGAVCDNIRRKNIKTLDEVVEKLKAALEEVKNEG